MNKIKNRNRAKKWLIDNQYPYMLDVGKADNPHDRKLMSEIMEQYFLDIIDVVEREPKIKTFDEAVRPLMKWLSEECHPHTRCIVGSDLAELVEGVESVKAKHKQ